jgi:hypothetical protein
VNIIFALILVMTLMAPVIIVDQIVAEGNYQNQTSYTLEEIQNICQNDLININNILLS